ncbi:TonB-dependent receptor [Shewanella cyperi]
MKPAQYSLLTLAIMACFPLAAQQMPADDKIERIIVSGSRVIESIDEIPASVTLIDRKTIEEQMLVNTQLQSILGLTVPGLSAATGTSSDSGQTLRGRQALIMIDGVPQSTPLRDGALGSRTLDPAAIERIEVIKGATSIFGNGAAGGVINYITKRPGKGELQARVGASANMSLVKAEDTLGHRLEAAADGSLGKFSYVVTLAREETGLQRDAEGDVIGLQYGLSDNKAQNLFTKLAYQFDGDKSLQASYSYYESQTDSDLVDVVGDVNTGIKTYAVKSSADNPLKGEPQGPRGNHNLMLKYTDEEIFSNTQLTLDAYGQRIENVFFFSPVLANPDEGYDGGQSMIKSEKMGLRGLLNTQYQWQDVEATFIYGTDLLNDVTSQPLLDGRMWVPEMDMSNRAFFLQTKWVIMDDFVIKAGIRDESIALEVDDYHTLKLCRKADQCSVPMAVKGDTLDYSATTYNLGLRYTGNSLFSPFINYSQGADISDIGRLLRTATVADIHDIRTEASIIDNYEVGFSSKLDALFFTFAAFRSTSELGTSNVFDEKTGVYMPVRAPQKIWGYEATADYEVNDTLNLKAAYSWLEGKDTETDTYLDGKQISAPKFTAAVNWQPLDNASLNLTYLLVGDRDRFDKVNGKWVGAQAPVHSYDLLNLSASYRLGQLKLFAGIENLLNRDYYSARSQVYTYSSYNTKALGTSLNLGLQYQF